MVPTQDQLQDAARGARDRGALWRFEKDGRHGYLYGTIHIANLDWAMPGPTVGRALSEVETVAIEADPAGRLDATLHELGALAQYFILGRG